jgi:hypothetical protein
MKPYPTLTVRGQTRRLRLPAINALASYNLDIACLRFLRRDIRLSGEGSWRLLFLFKRRKIV